MTKKAFVLAAIAFGLVASMSATAAVQGFTGPWAPGTWTTTFLGDVNPPGPLNNGTVNTAGAPNSITIVGGDDPGGIIGCVAGGLFGCEIRWNHFAMGGPISFNWSYSTGDSCGPQCDGFGVLLNGVEQFLYDPGSGQSIQSGTFSTGNAPLLTTFSFFVSTLDGIGGPATVVISEFSAPGVPEPATIALLGVGLAGLAASRRRKLN